LLPALKIHMHFHVDCLSPWKGNDVNGHVPPPLEPVEVEGEEEYKVEQVLDSWIYCKKLQYLVSWKGYPGQDSWEPEANLANSKDLVVEFHHKHPDAPQQISAMTLQSLPWQPIVNHTICADNGLEWETGRCEAGLSGRQALGRG
jgi:hypothetical protein